MNDPDLNWRLAIGFVCLSAFALTFGTLLALALKFG
jgi:hypothetical protein